MCVATITLDDVFWSCCLAQRVRAFFFALQDRDMYALRPVQDSCGPAADRLSCDAMTWLAQKEARENRAALDKMAHHPACSRYQSILDTDEEHRLIKTGQAVLQKNVCVVKTPEYQTGPWSAVFSGPPVPERFAAWTRAKGARETI